MYSFESIKASLIGRKTLFEDDDFRSDNASLGKMEIKVEGDIVWKRPKEIVSTPEFIVNKATRFDLIQGEIYNCWFVSAAACLASEAPALLERCVPSDQSFEKDYAGIFRFRFWNFGSWVDVYIDDRLPTVDNKLIFAHNVEEPNEFWVPLFEKAYAKLKGKYSDLDFGQTTYALVDFTGGITETISLREKRLMSGKLFDIMSSMSLKSSLMGCEIPSRTGQVEGKLPNGLYTAHAYSVTKIMTIPLKFGGRQVKLVRVRNPWGEGEWNGDWSDNSTKWDTVTEQLKNELQLMRRDDGEFWMSFEDWISRFEFLTICHLEPSSITTEIEQKHDKTGWESFSFHAEWITGFNAGGSNIFSFRRDVFFSNPQFKITLHPLAAQHDKPSCHMIVSLMQMTKFWNEQNSISFDIYQIREGVPDHGDMKSYKSEELTFAKKGPQPLNLREMTMHFELPPGHYIIIPFTLEPDKNGKFLLRVYTEYKSNDEARRFPTSVIPPRSPTTIEENSIQRVATELFKRGNPNRRDMDARELLGVLDYAFKNEKLSNGFTSAEASRCLVAIFGQSNPGLLEINEFCELWKEIGLWIEKFRRFDENKSGTIDFYELNQVCVSIGIHLSRTVLDALIGKYGGRSKTITADEFVLCSCKIKNIYEYFKELSGERKLKMNLEEWMSMALTF